MYGSNANNKFGFPDQLAPMAEKETKEYGLKYAKAIDAQWGKISERGSLFKKRYEQFEKNRSYANGTQDTTIYKKILTSLDPNANDGTLLNLDFSPVPVLPKFVRVVANKILSLNPYPNLEAVDPISGTEKEKMKRNLLFEMKNKDKFKKVEEETGSQLTSVPADQLPDSSEEAEVFMATNLKTAAEIAAQMATSLTLEWNDFNDSTYRRVVNDLVVCGIGAVKRTNDPSYGIVTRYVDPTCFIHSFTEDPGLDDMVYAGEMRKITIGELRRLAGEELTEEQLKKIAEVSKSKYSYDSKDMHQHRYDSSSGKNAYGYDDFVVDVMDFEFLSTDKIYFEQKTNRYGNENFYMKGFDKQPKGVFGEDAHCMHVTNVYGGMYIQGCNMIINYGRQANIPKNLYDITRAKLSYSVVATNMRNMMPKSMVDSCISFSDQIQLTHLKIQQAIAKAKPDGLIIDIEALENVQLGKGGELQPLELHDIYEQTGVFYYRGKNPDGSQQAPPIREIGNSIRNINEMIALYNHYMRMIRDVTGVNEAMDASTPKGDALVGVQQIAIQSGNNAIYDITNAAAILYKKVCQDIVKCLQIVHPESILFSIYERALGKNNMDTISEFRDLPMYNFGVVVEKDMEEKDRQFLEQNIQVALGQKEIDLEDAVAIRQLKDVGQAEKVLMVRRKKRREAAQKAAQQQQQAQAQAKMQEMQAQMQAKQQEMQMVIQAEVSKIGTKMKAEMQLEQMKQEHEMKIMEMKLRIAEATRQDDVQSRKEVERMKDDRKDERVKKQAVEQSKLISQRQGQRGELKEESNSADIGQALANQAINQK
jgi:hypothetical protein